MRKMDSKKITVIIVLVITAAAFFGIWKVLDDDRIEKILLSENSDTYTDEKTEDEGENLPNLSSDNVKERIETTLISTEDEKIGSKIKYRRITVKGRFIDTEGLPVDSVQLKTCWTDFPVETVSGIDGRFSFVQKLGDSGWVTYFKLKSEKVGYALHEESIETETLTEDTIYIGDITLKHGGGVSGIVLSRLGEPLPRANLFFAAPDLEDRDETDLRCSGPYHSGEIYKTKNDGTFELIGVPTGYVRIWAYSKGTQYSYTDTIEIIKGEIIRGVRLYLDPLDTENMISGTVLMPDGSPARNAKLRLSYKGFFTGSGSTTLQADKEGRFQKNVTKRINHTVEAIDKKEKCSPAVVSGVSPGASDLVLQLTKAVKIKLIIMDDGIAEFKKFNLSIWNKEIRSVHKYLHFQIEDLNEHGEIELSAPNLPFELTVNAPGFHIVKLGPFNPGAVPDPMVINLKSLPGVRGMVLASGSPAEGVSISLHKEQGVDGIYKINGFPARSERSYSAVDVSSADGLFNIPISRSGVYYLRAEKDGFAPAETGPHQINHANGMKGLAISLTRGGAIQGRVITSNGVDPSGLIVGIYRGDGFVKTKRTGAEGEYFFEKLTPGRWMVEICKDEISSRNMSASYSSEGNNETPPIPWVCEVVANYTTTYNLERLEGTGNLIKGKLTLDGATPVGWKADICADNGGSLLMVVCEKEVGLDKNGCFEINAEREGAYILSLSGPAGKGPNLRIRDEIKLKPGITNWDYDLKMGQVVINNLGELTGPGVYILYKWTGAGNIQTFNTISDKAKIDSVTLWAPAGNGAIIKATYDIHSRSGFKEELLREVVIPKGGVVTVDL